MFKQHILNEHSSLIERENGFRFYCKHCDFGTYSVDLYNIHNNSKKHNKYIKRLII
jgi:hypothetical protein